jgi:hypothetical protein
MLSFPQSLLELAQGLSNGLTDAGQFMCHGIGCAIHSRERLAMAAINYGMLSQYAADTGDETIARERIPEWDVVTRRHATCAQKPCHHGRWQ